MLRAVSQRLRSGSSTVLYECRRCGTTLDAAETACPYCGRSDAVRYEF